MTQDLRNRLIALFLLMVFSINTIAGFACSVGIDMGYNSRHHLHEKAHHHIDNKGHHKHNYIDKHPPISQFKGAVSNDDCCSNDVVNFTLLDKSVANKNVHLQVPTFFAAFSKTFLLQTINEGRLAVNSKFQFVRRSSVLNDTDIRIAIQSFQI